MLKTQFHFSSSKSSVLMSVPDPGTNCASAADENAPQTKAATMAALHARRVEPMTMTGDPLQNPKSGNETAHLLRGASARHFYRRALRCCPTGSACAADENL